MPGDLESQFRLRRLLLIVSMWSILLAVCALSPHFRPHRSVWWGPMHLALDGSLSAVLTSWAMVLASVAMVAPLTLRFTPWTALSAGCGIAWWLLMGLLGLGIDV